MAEQNLGPRDFFVKEDAIADLGLIASPRCRRTLQARGQSPCPLGT